MPIKAYYNAPVYRFLEDDADRILGVLTVEHHHALEEQQHWAWLQQLSILKVALAGRTDGRIFLEFYIPRMGKKVCATYQSLPFGNYFTSSGTGLCSNADSSDQHFTGKQRDTESGLDYFGARYLSSTLGRWMSPDWSAKAEPVPYAKLDNPQSLNLYSYGLNNPLRNIDPDGHAPCEQCGAILALMSKGVSAGDAMQAVNNAGTTAQQQSGQKLKYKTVSGGQHSSSWEINWSLTHNTKTGGWIVQHIVADFEGSTQCGGHGQCNYWEAWQVAPNSHTPLLHGLDANGTSYSDMFGGGAGSHVHASATFYEGLTLPSSFTVQPEGFPAGDLRSTTTNPNLPTDNATAPNVRWWGPQ